MGNKFSFHKSLVLRTPALPRKNSITIGELKQLLGDNRILEALYVASPSLYEEIKKYREATLSPKEEEKVLISCYKYLSRMMNRATPFGLFSGCSVLEWGKKTNITLPDSQGAQRYTRLDMFYLCKLVQHLETFEFIRKHLKFYLNSSANINGKKLTYVEYKYKKGFRLHSMSEVELDEYLVFVIKQVKRGLDFQALVSKIQHYDPEVTLSEAEAYICNLIDSQILKSELEPNVTGPEFFTEVLRVLERINHQDERINSIYQKLAKVKARLSAIDQIKEADCDRYNEIHQMLKTFDVEIDLSKLFQVDMHKESEFSNSLSFDVQDELRDCISFLSSIYTHPANQNLENFASSFFNRYDMEEVKLLDVVDTERGIGYPVQDSKIENPLTQELNIGHLNPLNTKNNIQLTFLQGILLNQLTMENDLKEIDLNTISELKYFKPANLAFAPSMAVFFKAIDHGSISVYLKGVYGATGAFFNGRFAHSNPKINELIKDVIAAENKTIPSDTIMVEIAHLPDDRLGNVVVRPSFRGYEIPYLAKSLVAENMQIPLSDITISMHPKTRVFTLRSRKLNKKILPRHSNAYNSSINNHSVFRLLNDLQTQENIQSLQVNWGHLKNLFKHLPRLKYKNVLLKRESWNLKKEDFQEVVKGTESLEDWKRRFSIPETFILADGDNELLIDLSEELSVLVFKDMIKKRSQISLFEHLFPENNGFVKDIHNSNYSNEFIATLISQKQPKEILPEPAKEDSTVDITRKFVCGESWLYYKLYCGMEFADTLICNYLLPLAEKFKEEQIISHWFFIRYKESHFHIRFRLFFPRPIDQGLFLKAFAALIEQPQREGLIWKVETSTYTRELERYGFQTMEFSEKLFYYDSLFVAKSIALIEKFEYPDIREFAGFLSIDNFLENFGFSLERKKLELEKLKDYFGQEFGLENKSFKKSLDKKYRYLRKGLDELFNEKYRFEVNLKELLIARSSAILSEGIDLKLVEKRLPSYLHMNINRLFPTLQRLNEFILYYCLFKHYESLIARKKYTTAK